MGAKQQLYTEFLQKEGYVPEARESGDVQFKYQGEIFIITAAEDDPNYFKISYYHKWDPESTEQMWPLLNALNAKFKVVKVSALNDVICLTTETLLREPSDFEALFARCLQTILTSKHQLALALAQRAAPIAAASAH